MFELNSVKRRIGRRIYFPTESVAALLNGEFDTSHKAIIEDQSS